MLNTPRKLHFNSDEERELAAQAFLETLFPYIPLRIEFQVMDAIRSYYQKNNIEYSSEQIQKMVELQDVIDTILIDEYLAVREAPNVYSIKLTELGRERKQKSLGNKSLDNHPSTKPIIQNINNHFHDNKGQVAIGNNVSFGDNNPKVNTESDEALSLTRKGIKLSKTQTFLAIAGLLLSTIGWLLSYYKIWPFR